MNNHEHNRVKLIEPGGVSTDFGGRSMTYAMLTELPEYMPLAQKVLADFQAHGSASTAEQIATGIYAAATDGKPQLRYLLGEDAKQTFAMRQQAGDDAFMAGMRQRMFGSIDPQNR